MAAAAAAREARSADPRNTMTGRRGRTRRTSIVDRAHGREGERDPRGAGLELTFHLRLRPSLTDQHQPKIRLIVRNYREGIDQQRVALRVAVVADAADDVVIVADRHRPAQAERTVPEIGAINSTPSRMMRSFAGSVCDRSANSADRCRVGHDCVGHPIDEPVDRPAKGPNRVWAPDVPPARDHDGRPGDERPMAARTSDG